MALTPEEEKRKFQAEFLASECEKITAKHLKGASTIEMVAVIVALTYITDYLIGVPSGVKIRTLSILKEYYEKADGILK